MYCYEKAIASTRERLKDRVRCDSTLPETTKRKKLYALQQMNDEEIERAALRNKLPVIERPMCGPIPFKPSMTTTATVRALVKERYRVGERTRLLCNVGCEGSGKTVMLHTTAAAVHMMEGMVSECTNDDGTERERWRPLGFYVSFAGDTVRSETAGELHKQTSFPILTAIAIRMVYSVIDDYCGMRVPYQTFVAEVLAACNRRWDEENFRGIVAALRAVLEWDGPMFIAVDDFKRAYGQELSSIVAGLQCRALLVSEKTLPISSGARPPVYESYAAVSAHSAVDAFIAAAEFERELIMQPMLMLGVRDIATLLSHYAATWLPNQYNKLFDRASGLRMLSIAQVVFLVNISLCAGRVLALSDCLGF
ncbi:multi-copy leucine-rich repeat protein, putative [Bodo saltans]|uniref:Multi-copy leucine-rich repeat protein, putative n=1 Tax=Bodo saltans TaxID=75058 RepID=A0A0S4JCQ2_BODSA|nr:multi-copy leucine-rich repeat protein, putative [Bodo saltans]|eukprot:CUG87910.1 multi-copy leucine-rich repeat protein, putative [Bodo saltans]